MKKTYNVTIASMFLYAIVLFLSNYAAYFVSGTLVGLFQPIADKIPFTLLAIFIFAIYILMGFSLPFLTIFFFFKYAVQKQYVPSEDSSLWVKSCFRLILPAEIIRFLVCQLTLGQINTTGSFALLPTLLFENTYLLWTGRSEQVRQTLLQYNFADFAVYALCFFIYAAIHLVLVMMIYRRFWLEAKKDREDLIVHE
jgi:hypothetical protein